jgi:competence protein ComEC
VGLTHIVVASGYNLSILVRFSRKIFGKISRFAALFVSLILIFMFMTITGWTPSMLRAGMVAVLSLLTWYVGRNFHPVKLIFLVAAATLLINPNYIVDLGWILSIASFAGVIIVAPLITAYFYGGKKPNFIARIVLETVAAQIVCLPILLFFFGSFSLISVVANVLVVPTIPVVMALTFATGVVSFLPFLAQIVGFVATVILKYHILVIDFFGAQTNFLVTIPPECLRVLFLYVPIAGFLIYARKKTGFSLRPVNIVA